MRNAPPAQPNQGLMDGLAVLQALATHREPVAGKELALQLDLEPTRVNRLLKTLAYLGIAYRTTNRKYTSGPGMHVLAAQSLFASGLIQRALSPLEELSRLRKLIAMGVLWRDRVSYLYFWHAGMTTAEALGRSALHPATKSSIGMALLAEKPDDELRALYRGKEIPGFKGIRSLLEHVRATREQGYALVPTGEGTTLGMKFGRPAYAAIAISGAIAKSDVRGLVEILRDTVAKIEGTEAGDVNNAQ